MPGTGRSPPHSPLNLNVDDDDYRLDVDTSKVINEAPSAQLLNLPEACDKFRILIIGRAAVGKSTICSKAFGISPEKAGISHYSVGTAMERVWYPLTFEGANENLIIHDSGGFEAGDLSCVNTITDFIQFRKKQHRLAGQLHRIWHCISCSSNRPIQEAELHFFQKADIGNIPVVVVFTQFDKLVDDALINLINEEMKNGNFRPDIPRLRKLAYNAAVAKYEKEYRGQFERTFERRNRVAITRIGIRPDDENGAGPPISGVDTLVQETREILLEDGLKLLWAAAQAHSADVKLQASIDAGMATFWRTVSLNTIPFVPFVSAIGLYSAFNRILATINTVWRIPGCDRLILSSKMRNRILQGCFDVKVLDRIGAQFLMSLNIFGPLTSGQTAMVLFKMIAGVSLLYESIFWECKNRFDGRVTPELMERLIYKFQKSDGRLKMASHLTATISTGIADNKGACKRELLKAVEYGRNEKIKNLIQRHTIAGEDE